MITKWKVKNFKSIRDETELDFAPITLFAGANSSGKSSFIQTILLTAQTLIHKVNSQSMVLNGDFANLGQFDDILSDNCDEDQIIVECTCRPWKQLDYTGSQSTHSFFPSELSSSLHPASLEETSCELAFDAVSRSSQVDLQQVHPRIVSIQISCSGRDKENIDQKAGISIKLSEKAISELTERLGESIHDEELRDSFNFDVTLDENSLNEVMEIFRSAESVGCNLEHFLPTEIIYATDPIVEKANTITQALQNSGLQTQRHSRYIRNYVISTRQTRWQPTRFSPAFEREVTLSKEILDIIHKVINDDEISMKLDSIRAHDLFGLTAISLSEWSDFINLLNTHEKTSIRSAFHDCENLFQLIKTAIDSSADKEVEVVEIKTPHLITKSNEYLEKFLTSSLKYLGPLREPPKSIYPLEQIADPDNLGKSGELTAPVLELHKSTMIQYLPSSNFKKAEFDRRIATRTLETAVIDWLGYLGVVSKLDSRTRGKFGYELTVGFDDSTRNRDLTHVGVGVSQVLPIVVMGLLAEADSALIFEQPELHLHPKVQTLLGDFFLSLIMCKKQCIIETHSEYIIDRLRYRIAATSPKNELHNLAKIYFVENSSQLSTFREVKINKFGAISDWPKDFFDQSQQNAEDILTSAVEKEDKFGE